ncbi:hypothetical protein HX021_14415 [Sphingobacterium sp. N143]|uniref:hypothetical protein n=1 Tax=Sphingobacterium sp. N143 TaxID=2746727 RepID=UPI0025784EAD|nr:hypothetical protein [Sphingobacterium sp. N143]MDM1295480.1 hypothetical protein [Sphingobacterium sp. N143]
MRRIRIHIGVVGVFLLLLSTFNARAQHIQKVSGMVMQKGTANRIGDVVVHNLRTNRSVMTNSFGVFTIDASVGDSLSFTKVGFSPVKTALTDLDEFYIEMQEGIKLETVTVERKSKEAELNEAMGNYSKKGVYNGGKNKFGTYLGSPATALYNLFGREAKNAKRFGRFMDREKEELQVDRIFSRQAVKNLTKLDSADLDAFMVRYRPSFELAEHWGQYDLMHYVQQSLEDFNAQGRPKESLLPDIEVKTQEK